MNFYKKTPNSDIAIRVSLINTDSAFKSELVASNIEVDFARFYNNDIVDVRACNDFYIDDVGNKHLEQFEPQWQKLTCKYDDVVIHDLGHWRIRNANDEYQEMFNRVDDARRGLYTTMVDPLFAEANVKALMGAAAAEIDELNTQALAARQKIQTDNPWPVAPKV